MKLTREWLKEAATLSSLYKGDDYYEEVAELQKEQNKYTAIVYGSIIYDVQIEENELNIDCFCTCEEDVSGLCSHVVAVCLNIIDEQYEEVNNEPLADLEEAIELTDYRIKDGKHFYQNVFTEASEDLQQDFLQQLFETKESLRKKFIELIDYHKKYKVSIDISSLRKTIFNQLCTLDFTAQYEVTHSAATPLLQEEKAIETIETSLNPYGEKALDFIEKGFLTNALTVYLGMFEASFGLPEPNWVAEPLIDDFEAETRTVCKNWQQTIVEALTDTTLDEAQVKDSINLIFDRWQVYQTTDEPTDVYYDFKFFEPFLIAFLTPNSAAFLKNKLLDNQLVNYQTAMLALHTAHLLKDDVWWLEIAENFAGNDPEIAKKLLVYYHNLDETEAFYRIAQYTFDLFPNQLDAFLLNYVHPKTDTPFYVKLLKNYAQTQQTIEAFKTLRTYISTEEKELFIENNAPSPVFYAQLLAAELRFSEILELAKAHQNAWEFNAIVQPILHVYPLAIFDLCVKRTVENLTFQATNKKEYDRIFKNLKPILDIKNIDTQRKDFIKRLKKQFKHRPSILEALEENGF